MHMNAPKISQNYPKLQIHAAEKQPPQLLCLRYNCHSGYSNWFFGWSAHKKSWCCDHRHLGCPGTWHGSYHLHTNILHGVGHAHGRIYDCHAGFSNWKQGWSDSKKDWCCSHEKKGCLKYHCHSNALWPRSVRYFGVFLSHFLSTLARTCKYTFANKSKNSRNFGDFCVVCLSHRKILQGM